MGHWLQIVVCFYRTQPSYSIYVYSFHNTKFHSVSLVTACQVSGAKADWCKQGLNYVLIERGLWKIALCERLISCSFQEVNKRLPMDLWLNNYTSPFKPFVYVVVKNKMKSLATAAVVVCRRCPFLKIVWHHHHGMIDSQPSLNFCNKVSFSHAKHASLLLLCLLPW